MLYWFRFSFALCAWKLVFVWAATLWRWIRDIFLKPWKRYAGLDGKNVNIKGKVSKVNGNTCMLQRASGRVWCWLALCCVISSLVICACCCAVVLSWGEGDDYPSHTHTHVYTLPAATSWCHSPELLYPAPRGCWPMLEPSLMWDLAYLCSFLHMHMPKQMSQFSEPQRSQLRNPFCVFCKATFLLNGMRERVVFAQHYLRCQHFSSETHCGNAALLGFWTC